MGSLVLSAILIASNASVKRPINALHAPREITWHIRMDVLTHAGTALMLNLVIGNVRCVLRVALSVSDQPKISAWNVMKIWILKMENV